MPTTPIQALPYPPAVGATPDVPRDVKALAEAIETRLVMRFASIAERDTKLPSGQRVAGMLAWVDADQTYYTWTTSGWRIYWRTWTTYTPSVFNINLGNGSVSGRYCVIGGTVHYLATLTFGSTTTVTGSIVLGLPVDTRSDVALVTLGDVWLRDTSAAATRIWHATRWAASTISMSSESGASANATVPWTWGSGDSTYEAAA